MTVIQELRNTLGATLRAQGVPEPIIENRIIQEISRPTFNPGQYQPVTIPEPDQWTTTPDD